LLLGRIVQGLDAQHGLDPGHQGSLIHRLGEVFIGAGFEASDDVLGVGIGRDTV
jgi:hypothetical protein